MFPTSGSNDDLIGVLRNLRVDRSTGDPAPHKPLLILVFLDLFAEGEIRGDTIELTPEISFRFSNYWSVAGGRRRQRPDVRMPFHHLKGDGLVRPLTLDGRESPTKEVTVAVRLSEELIRIGSDETLRRQAQLMLIKKYFLAAEQLALCEMLSFSPSEVEQVGESLYRASEPEAVRRGRDARFRQVVVSAYDFTCALTGHRLITISAGSLVDAAHIRPVAHQGPCLIGNGVALCKNAHWAFDCGLWTFDSEYRVRVFHDSFQEKLLPEALGFLLRDAEGRRIHLPRRREHWPDAGFINWHNSQFGISGN
jgi:putative restriction endonuclease